MGLALPAAFPGVRFSPSSLCAMSTTIVASDSSPSFILCQLTWASAPAPSKKMNGLPTISLLASATRIHLHVTHLESPALNSIWIALSRVYKV